MNIQDMHNAFRVTAQQMGMQLNRGILPESIDIYLNSAITELARNTLLNGIRTAHQDTIDSQTTAMSNINAFRHLYRSMRLSIPLYKEEDYVDNTAKIKYYNPKNGYYIIRIPTVYSKVGTINDEYLIKPMMYLGFSLEYDNFSRGSATSTRLIGADQLETTLADMCNAASKANPIVCLSSLNTEGSDANGLDNPNEQLEIYTNTPNLEISYLNIKYVKAPNVVRFDNEISKCVNCDLPDFMHYDIIRLAVDRYYESIGAYSNKNKQ